MPFVGSANGFGYGRLQSGNVYYNNLGKAQWAAIVDGGGFDELRSIACDYNYNVYVAGVSQPQDAGGVRIYDASGTRQRLTNFFIPRLGTTSFNLAYLVKYSPNGNCQWVNAIDVGGNHDSTWNVRVDREQNIYIVGASLQNTTLFDASGFSVRQSPITLQRGWIGYICKVNPSGIFQWATGIVGVGTDMNLIAIDNNNDIYYGGNYRIPGTGRFILLDASGTGQVNSEYSILQTGDQNWNAIVKINSSGKTLWSVYVPSNPGTIVPTLFSMGGLATDANNNVYYGITYRANFTLVNASGFIQANSAYVLNTANQAAGLIKYSSSGQVQWCVDFNGTGVDDTRGIAVDSQNNIYWVGSYTSNTTGALIVRDTSGITQSNSLFTIRNTTGSFDSNIFIIKYNSEGKAQWATCCDQPTGGTTIAEFAYRVMMDSLDNLYICGKTNCNATFTIYDASGTTQRDSGISIVVPENTGECAFLVKYNSNGQAQWATNINGTGNDYWISLAFDRSNSLYVGGVTTGNLTVRDTSGNSQSNSLVTITPFNTNTFAGSFIKYR